MNRNAATDLLISRHMHQKCSSIYKVMPALFGTSDVKFARPSIHSELISASLRNTKQEDEVDDREKGGAHYGQRQ